MWSRVSCLCLKSAAFGGLYLFLLAGGGEHSCLSLRDAKAHSGAVWSVSLQRVHVIPLSPDEALAPG